MDLQLVCRRIGPLDIESEALALELALLELALVGRRMSSVGLG